MTRIVLIGFATALAFSPAIGRAKESTTKKIVFIAGKKSHGPVGNGIHDYPWSVKLLKVMLDNSNVADRCRVEYHLDGWVEDESTLDDADAIMVISDGRDGDAYEEAPQFASEEHRRRIAKQIARGCGFLTFHFSTFAPDQYADDILSWSGGYFDWETDGKKQWYSAIKTLETDVQLGTPEHAILRGVDPFKMREEFYYNIRFAADDASLKPLLVVPAVEGRPENGNVVAWAKERPDGGRGFGTTCGHFYDNWENAAFRKFMLNAIVWAAHGDVPPGGVEAKFYTHAEITAALSGKRGTERAVVDQRPIKALILTGHQYPGHLWKDTTPAIKEALQADRRIHVDASENIEDLATDKVAGYDLLVLNYCNWEKPGLSDAAKAGFVKYLTDGGGLIIVHFANGAFHFSLPKAGESDWPEYRKICRRVWDHTENKSGHDAYGKFVVDVAKDDHPITKGMEPFETIDELYFRQQGEEPIDVLLTAKSKITGRDEPMAFVYNYGKGRVMQTVLGHAAESLRTPGARELLRRSAGWVANREQTLASSQPAKPQASRLAEGKFGKALHASGGGLAAEGHADFRQPPLTVECWAKLSQRDNYNILVAQENKNSATHWELFTMAGNGRLTVYLPGSKPDHVSSDADVADDQWHYLAMVYERERVRLFVDGRQVADQKMAFQNGEMVPAGLAIGQLVDKSLGCTGLIDEVRISQGVREISGVPEKPFAADDATLGLWHFDELDEQGRSPDASKHNRPAATAELGKKKKASDNAFYHWSKDIVGFDWTEQDSVDNRWNQTDVGPFLASIVPMPGQPPVTKGLSIRVGDKQQASVCYDTQTLALRSAWTGGFLKFDPARYGIIAPPMMDGEVQFVSSPDAGWQAESVSFQGFRLHQRQLVLEAEVDGVRVRELPQFVERNQQSVFIRELQIDPGTKDLRLRLGRFSDVTAPKFIGPWQVVSWKSKDRRIFAAFREQNRTSWSVADGDVQLVVPARPNVVIASLWLFASENAPDKLLPETPAPDPRITLVDRLSNPGKPLWPSDLITHGTLGAESGPYQVDTLTIPFDNPAKALFFITGHDCFSNGDLAVCTVHGDVWRVSGVDHDLKELRWRRFATGLFQPLGLKIVDDVVHVLGRDRITKLHDDNADGFSDRYENFCDLYETSPSGHDYITCLETDPEGNFYFLHANHGLQKVSKDGTKLETVATGLRNPNGLSVSPTGEITAAPQEGEWTPASAIFMVRPGDHYGYNGPQITPERPLGYDPPLCWIPRLVDNSCGGQCWAPDDSWGLPAGSLLHFSFGQCTALLALRESVDGHWQGGVIPLPWKFQSGVSRGRFSPHDGQLYVSGLKGWVTSAVQDGCLQRVRYVGREVPWPVKMESYRNGIALTFGCRLDKDAAENPENYSLQACNYRYSQGYGSPDLRPSHPTVEGRDDWDVASATLLEDQKTVFLEIPDLAPVMQVVVNWSIMSADQVALANSYSGTVHRLPERSFAVPESSRKPRPGRLTKEQEAALVPGVLLTFQQDDRRDVIPARMVACEFAPNQPPTPRLGPGPYEIHADGYVKAPLSGTYQFRIAGTTTARLRVNDEAVSEAAPVRLHKGYNRVSFTATSADSGWTSLRLMWQAGTFAEEPVPPTAWFREGQSEIARTMHRRRHARELFETFHCANCHQALPAGEKSTQVFHAPSLKDLSGRLTPRWLAAWLLDPRSIRHDAEMPALFDEKNAADRQAAADVAVFLLNGGETAGERREPDDAVDSGDVLYEELGCLACHRFTLPAEDDPWNRSSLHYTAEKFPRDSLVDYLRQSQRHHRFSRMPDFQLTPSEAEALAGYLQTHSTGRLDEPPELARADAVRGKKLFSERHCGQCHGPLEKKDAPIERIAFPQNGEGWNRGCLASGPAADSKSPRFPMDNDDRTALREFLMRASDGIPPMTPIERSGYLVRRLNCTACHHRDHIISPRGEIVAEESERGLPAPALPNLTFAGEKLEAVWMRRLFCGENPHKTRPWLSARMPAFSGYAEELAAGLGAEHGYGTEAESMAALNVNAELVEIGRKLTLKDNGLDCRQCHAVAGQQPTGDDKTKIAPGIDFAETKHRLRADFYRRFVLDPPRFDVTIRMPKLAIDGKTTQAVSVLDGDASRQFEALWQYIQSLPD